MLGDQAEKPKSSLKSAMRRRKKTVAFADPTIHSYSDYDYSTDEDLDSESFSQQDPEQANIWQQQQQQQHGGARTTDLSQESNDNQLEIVNNNDENIEVDSLGNKSQSATQNDRTKHEEIAATNSNVNRTDPKRTNDEITSAKSEPSRSRNGTVRNTDSFFKDESVETKKITLTPNLLRDDNEPRGSTDGIEVKQRPSFDKPEKDNEKREERKRKDKEKKDKDKKPGVIRSLFSRGKDKKKGIDDDGESVGKQSSDLGRDSHESLSEDAMQIIEPILDRQPGIPQRNGKFQKEQQLENDKGELPQTQKPMMNREQTSGGWISSQTTLRHIKSDPTDTDDTSSQSSSWHDITQVSPSLEPTAGFDGLGAARTSARSDFLMPSENETQCSLSLKAHQDNYAHPNALPVNIEEIAMPSSTDRKISSEPPIRILPNNQVNSPALINNLSPTHSPTSSPSPEPTEAENDESHQISDSVTASLSTGAVPTWSDTNLRAFFDSGLDIQNLLSIVYSKSDVVPVGPGHPIVGTLFKEQNTKLTEITNVSRLFMS